MLNTIRSKTASLVVKVLFIFLIGAFALWGIGDIFRHPNINTNVAEIGKNGRYSESEFNRDLKLAMEKFQGIELSLAQFRALGGVDQIVDQAVKRSLIDAYADRLGLAVSQETAVKAIQNDPSFHNDLGAFDRRRFLAILQNNRMDEQGYVEGVRQDMRASQLYRAAFDGIAAPAKLTSALYTYAAETRIADMLVIPFDRANNVAAPSDDDLSKFYSAHTDLYMKPEYRSAQVILLSPADFAKNVTISDEEIAQDYAARQAEYTTPETRVIEQTVVQDPTQADKIAAAVKSGSRYVDAVKTITGGAPIDLGAITKDKLPVGIADAVFALGQDQVSAPLHSPFGIHIVHVKSITPGETKSLEGVKEQIRQTLQMAKAGDDLVSVANQLDDTLAGGTSLQDAAQKLGLTLATYAAIDSGGHDKSGKDLAIGPDILRLINQTESGASSPVTTLADNNYAAVQVTSIEPAATEPLDQVKERVKTDWIAEQKRNWAQSKAEEISKALQSGGDLRTLANGLGQQVKTTQPFNRMAGSPKDGVTPELAIEIFGQKTGGSVVGQNGQGAVVAQVTAIVPGNPANHADELKNLQNALTQKIRLDLSVQFSSALKEIIPVKINQPLIDKLTKDDAS